jgi:O-antigen ligase
MLVAAAFAICSAIAAGTLLSGGYLLLDRFGLIAFLVFTLTPYAFGDERHRTALLWALTGLGLYLGVTAIFEIVGPAALVFPRYINDPTVGIHFGRARGPFAEAATNGMALSTCGAAAAILTLRRTVGAKRLLSGAVLTLCALGVLLTLQRTAWLGAFAGVIVMMLSRAPLRRRLLAVLLAGALLVGAALVTIPGLAERAKTRGTDQETVWDRTNLARASIAMMLERPLTGFGWDRFHDESKPYFWQHGDTPLTASKGIPHNAILANAAELGVVGTVLWLLALVLAVASALTARLPASALPWRDGLILLSIVVLALMLFTPMVSPFPLLALMLWAGVVRAQALGGKAS